jgi:hypothetical protein
VGAPLSRIVVQGAAPDRFGWCLPAAVVLSDNEGNGGDQEKKTAPAMVRIAEA